MGRAEAPRVLGRLNAARGEQNEALQFLQQARELFAAEQYAPGCTAQLNNASLAQELATAATNLLSELKLEEHPHQRKRENLERLRAIDSP